MPVAAYDPLFGGKKGAAAEVHASMVKQYGKKRGNEVFYGLVNKRKKLAAQIKGRR